MRPAPICQLGKPGRRVEGNLNVLVLLVIALVWLVAGLGIAALCRAAASGDRTEIVASLDDLAVAA